MVLCVAAKASHVKGRGDHEVVEGFFTAARQRDFITSHSSITAGFYELQAICHENWVYTGFTAGRLLAVPYGIAIRR